MDRLQLKALRICIGAIKSTPNNAVLIEEGETPLALRREMLARVYLRREMLALVYLRREMLALVYWGRLTGSREDTPAKETTQNCWEYAKFLGSGFGWTCKDKVRTYGLEALEVTRSAAVSNVPPGCSLKL